MLAEIFEKYQAAPGGDCQTGTDKNTTHCYADLYDTVLHPSRERIQSVLEIGIFSGASLCAWADYFPNAHVLGVDITLDRVTYGRDHPRIQMVCADGTTEETAKSFGKMFDFILDDGSHDPNHQVQSLRAFLPYLNQGGIYIIEDISGYSADTLKSTLEQTAAHHGVRMEWHDLRHVKGRFDDIVAVFYR